jgi:hypothetical protein
MFVMWLFFAMTFALQAESIKPDTQSLAGALKAIRGEPGPSKERFRAIQGAFFEWIDVRLRNQDTTELNRELREAGAFDSRRHDDQLNEGFPNLTGYLDKIQVDPAPDDLLALRIGVGTTCCYDQTIILYQREPWRRIGWLNHGEIEGGVGYVFSSFTIGARDAEGRRLIAAGQYDEWCTSTMIQANFRISAIEGSSLKTLLNRNLNARRDLAAFHLVGNPITATIDGNTVIFRYLVDRFKPALERYVVSGETAKLVAR